VAGVYGDNIGRWQVESEHFSSRAAVGLCVTSGEVGSMGFVPSRIVLSTAGTHTLWMFVAGGAGSTVSAPWGRRRFMTGCAVSGSMLMCRQVVLISMVTQAGTALMSTCLVRPWWWGPSGPGARGLTGHPGRERTIRKRGGQAMSWGLAGRGGLAQRLLRKSPQEQRPDRLVIPRRARPMIFLQRPLRWWAIGLAGTGQRRQRVPRGHHAMPSGSGRGGVFVIWAVRIPALAR
jgi:hypothetical protein